MFISMYVNVGVYVSKVHACLYVSMCHKFGYEYVTKVLINPRAVGNSIYFVPKITSLGSHDIDNVMNIIVHA